MLEGCKARFRKRSSELYKRGVKNMDRSSVRGTIGILTKVILTRVSNWGWQPELITRVNKTLGWQPELICGREKSSKIGLREYMEMNCNERMMFLKWV